MLDDKATRMDTTQSQQVISEVLLEKRQKKRPKLRGKAAWEEWDMEPE